MGCDNEAIKGEGRAEVEKVKMKTTSYTNTNISTHTRVHETHNCLLWYLD